MRRLLRIILWMVKGLMLLIALAALVMWPASSGRWIGVAAQRCTTGPASGERRWYSAECWDGVAILGRGRRYAWGDPWLARIRKDVEAGSDGWRWVRGSGAPAGNETYWPLRRGLVRWRFIDDTKPDETYRYRYVAAPLWTIALVAGAWPLTSITFALRRRAKRRRAAREGLCKH